jgi:hypothetical protein
MGTFYSLFFNSFGLPGTSLLVGNWLIGNLIFSESAVVEQLMRERCAFAGLKTADEQLLSIRGIGNDIRVAFE